MLFDEMWLIIITRMNIKDSHSTERDDETLHSCLKQTPH